MSILKILLTEIGYRKLNFAVSLLAVMMAAILFVAGPMLVEAYSRATETELGRLQGRVAESSQRLHEVEARREAELAELEDETRKVMRDMGFNLAILARNADTIQFLDTGQPSETMPQEFVDRLAEDSRLTMVTHLVATLTGRIEFSDDKFDNNDVLLVGYLPETPNSHKPAAQSLKPRNAFAAAMQAVRKPTEEQQGTAFARKTAKKKKPMGYAIEQGTVVLGHAVGRERGVGDTIELSGHTFRIARILPEKGTREDITIAMHLDDAQQLLDKPKLINEIKALECRCTEAALPAIRRQIGQILPEVQVFRDNSKADARAKQRAMVQQKHNLIVASHKEAVEERQRTLSETEDRREKIQALMTTLAYVVTPLVVLACAIWVGLLALANVRERRIEIGILRALGKGSVTVASLLLGKAVLLGLIGATLGFALGSALAHGLGVWVLGVGSGQFSIDYRLLLGALIGAPLLSAMASYLPTLSALSQDPAVVLRDQ